MTKKTTKKKRLPAIALTKPLPEQLRKKTAKKPVALKKRIPKDPVRRIAAQLVDACLLGGPKGPMVIPMERVGELVRELAGTLPKDTSLLFVDTWITPGVNGGDFPEPGSRVLIRFRQPVHYLMGQWLYSLTTQWTKEFKRQFDGYDWQWKPLDPEGDLIGV